MFSKLSEVFRWLQDNVLAVLIASFVIPGTLSVFNQQIEITKAIYETDYKAAKTKFLECSGLHTEYLSAASANAGSAQLLQRHFNIESSAKYGVSETYVVAFRATMDAYLKSLESVNVISGKVSRCDRELHGLYENLALMLDLNSEFQAAKKHETEKIAMLSAQRDAIANDLQKRTDARAIFQSIITGDTKGMADLLQSTNFGDLSKLQLKNIELVTAVQTQQHAQFNELNVLFSEELRRRFHRGLFSYFGTLV